MVQTYPFDMGSKNFMRAPAFIIWYGEKGPWYYYHKN